MIDKIKKVVDEINRDFLKNSKSNTFEMRREFAERLESEIEGVSVICDERINPPDVIELKCVVAHINWRDKNNKQLACYAMLGKQENKNRVRLLF